VVVAAGGGVVVAGLVVEVAGDVTERGGVVLVGDGGVPGGKVVELGDDRLGDLGGGDAAEDADRPVAERVVVGRGVSCGGDRVGDVGWEGVGDEADRFPHVVLGHVVVAEALHVAGRVRGELGLGLGFEDQSAHHVQKGRALHRSSKIWQPTGPVGSCSHARSRRDPRHRGTPPRSPYRAAGSVSAPCRRAIDGGTTGREPV
jgi:hypothetical protein